MYHSTPQYVAPLFNSTFLFKMWTSGMLNQLLKTITLLDNELYTLTLTISLGPAFSDRFSIGNESAMVFSVVLLSDNKIKLVKISWFVLKLFREANRPGHYKGPCQAWAVFVRMAWRIQDGNCFPNPHSLVYPLLTVRLFDVFHCAK